MNNEERPQQETRNSVVLEDFMKFCRDNPQLRFWQALRAWSGHQVYLSDVQPLDLPPGFTDPFYREGRDV